MELTPRELAAKAVEHAKRGVDRARGRCLKAWNAWLDATEDRRRAMEILCEAERAARAVVASAGEDSTNGTDETNGTNGRDAK